jgi:hypothetical protein
MSHNRIMISCAVDPYMRTKMRVTFMREVVVCKFSKFLGVFDLLPAYNVTTDEKARTVTCWIPSEAGKMWLEIFFKLNGF